MYLLGQAGIGVRGLVPAHTAHAVQCHTSPPPHRRCAGAHILEARSVSLDASRHNSTLTKILDEQLFRGAFVTLAPLFLPESSL